MNRIMPRFFENSSAATVDIVGMRDEVISYLKKYSSRRQEIIGDLTGVRRESVNAYARNSGLKEPELIQRFYDWMIQDKENKQQLTAEQLKWLVSNARRNLKSVDGDYARNKWERKLEKYLGMQEAIES